MRRIINKLFEDKIAGWSTGISAFLILISLITILVMYRFLPPYIPLYNKMSWGYARVGHTFELFSPVLLAMLFLGINSYLGINLRQKAPLLSRFLFVTSVSVSIFTTFFIIKLITIVI